MEWRLSMKWRAMPLLIFVAAALPLSAAEETTVLNVLAFDLPQALAEQRLADTNFTAKTGIKVVLETNSPGDVQRKLDQIISRKDAHFDLVQYDTSSLGRLV